MPMPFTTIRRWASGSSTASERRHDGPSANVLPHAPVTSHRRDSSRVTEEAAAEVSHNHPSSQSEQTQGGNGKSESPAPEDNDDDGFEEDGTFTPPNSPTDALSLHIHNMELYRLGPDALSTLFRPKTRGQRAVVRFMSGEAEALREILQERDHAARLAISAPQIMGTTATHRWLQDPGPRTLAELLTERDAAASKLRREAKNFSWPWNKPAPSGGTGLASGSARVSTEAAVPEPTPKSIIRFGKCPGHTATCGMYEGCNIGQPPFFSTQTLRARMLQEARTHGDKDFERMRGTFPPRRMSGDGECSTSVEPRWPFSSALIDDEDDEDGSSVSESLEDEDFMDGVYDLVQEAPCRVAEEVRFQRAQVVDTSDPEADSTDSSEQSDYDEEQQDGEGEESDEEFVPLRRCGSRVQSSPSSGLWTTLPIQPVPPPVDSPTARLTTETFVNANLRNTYFNDPEDGRRIVPRLYYLPPFYPWYGPDGLARVRELHTLCGCPPNYKAADVILALLRYKPETRTFMARKVPGVARRANQINWRGVDGGISTDQDRKLFWEWEESRQPLFKIQNEKERTPLGEVAGNGGAERLRGVTSKPQRRHLTWKPVKSKLFEVTTD